MPRIRKPRSARVWRFESRDQAISETKVVIEVIPGKRSDEKTVVYDKNAKFELAVISLEQTYEECERKAGVCLRMQADALPQASLPCLGKVKISSRLRKDRRILHTFDFDTKKCAVSGKWLQLNPATEQYVVQVCVAGGPTAAGGGGHSAANAAVAGANAAVAGANAAVVGANAAVAGAETTASDADMTAANATNAAATVASKLRAERVALTLPFDKFRTPHTGL